MNRSIIDKYSLNINPSNKSMRIPVCFCIEASKDMWFNVIKDDLVRFFRKINEDTSLASSVEIAVVTFGGDKIEIVRPFMLVGNEMINIREIKSEKAPDLNQALIRCIQMIQSQKCDYNNASLNYSQPSIVLFASGNCSSESLSEAISKIKTGTIKGTLKVFPMQTQEKNINILKNISSDGNVYVSLDGTYSSLFKKIGKSLENLSASTSQAFASMVEAAPEEWDSLIRK